MNVYLKLTTRQRQNHTQFKIKMDGKCCDSLSSCNAQPCGIQIARWLKAVLPLAGIDNCIFKGHSFGGALTSKAVSLQVSLDAVLKAADWRNTGILQRSIKEKRLLLANLLRLLLVL